MYSKNWLGRALTVWTSPAEVCSSVSKADGLNRADEFAKAGHLGFNQEVSRA